VTGARDVHGRVADGGGSGWVRGGMEGGPNLEGREDPHGVQPGGLRRRMRSFGASASTGAKKKPSPGAGDHHHRRSGGDQKEGLGRTRTWAEVRPRSEGAYSRAPEGSPRHRHRGDVVPRARRRGREREGGRVGEAGGRGAGCQRSGRAGVRLGH